MKMVQDIQLPVIAEVYGLAAAAGCQLVASCDVVVAAENAQFSTPGVKAGLFCSTPGIALSRAANRKVALDMLLTGRNISAQVYNCLTTTTKQWAQMKHIDPEAEAVRAGLVSRVAPESAVAEETLDVARAICRLSRPVLALGKAFFYSQLEADRNTAYRHGERVMIENLRLADCQEGIEAFLRKREPSWTHSTATVS